MSIGIIEKDLGTKGGETYKLSGPFKPQEAKMFLSDQGLVELRTETRRIFIPAEKFGSNKYGIFSWKLEQPSEPEQLHKKKGRNRFGF